MERRQEHKCRGLPFKANGLSLNIEFVCGFNLNQSGCDVIPGKGSNRSLDLTLNLWI